MQPALVKKKKILIASQKKDCDMIMSMDFKGLQFEYLCNIGPSQLVHGISFHLNHPLYIDSLRVFLKQILHIYDGLISEYFIDQFLLLL